MSDTQRPPAPAAPAGKDLDREARSAAVIDAADQIQRLLQHTERSLSLLEPPRPEIVSHYDDLRRMRDRLEEAFTVAQTEKLRAGGLDFEADVDKLRSVIHDLEQATQRAARAKEIIGYVTMAVELLASVVTKIISFV